jgi:ankyrin repeat protein
LAKYLIDKKAYLNEKDEYGQTALHLGDFKHAN